MTKRLLFILSLPFRMTIITLLFIIILIPITIEIIKWTITGNEKGEGSGYPLLPEHLLANDNQAVYKALMKRDYIIVDRHHFKQFRPEGGKILCIDCNPDMVHMHTWNVPSGDPNGRNGFDDVQYLHGVPWDNDTQFYTISEAWEKGLIRECQI